MKTGLSVTDKTAHIMILPTDKLVWKKLVLKLCGARHLGGRDKLISEFKAILVNKAVPGQQATQWDRLNKEIL